MKHIWTVLCQKSSIDVETNLLSMFSCVEELSLQLDKTKPTADKLVIPIDLQLVSFWAVEKPEQDNSLELEGELISPDGEVLNKFSNQFKIKAGILRFRNRTNVHGWPVQGEGRYWIKIKQKVAGAKDFSLITELPLDIKISYKLMEVPPLKA